MPFPRESKTLTYIASPESEPYLYQKKNVVRKAPGNAKTLVNVSVGKGRSEDLCQQPECGGSLFQYPLTMNLP